MPLILADKNCDLCIKKIKGNDETKKFLNNLGFIVGEMVSVVSEIGGSVIIKVKDTRVALNKEMALRIVV